MKRHLSLTTFAAIVCFIVTPVIAWHNRTSEVHHASVILPATTIEYGASGGQAIITSQFALRAMGGGGGSIPLGSGSGSSGGSSITPSEGTGGDNLVAPGDGGGGGAGETGSNGGNDGNGVSDAHSIPSDGHSQRTFSETPLLGWALVPLIGTTPALGSIGVYRAQSECERKVGQGDAGPTNSCVPVFLMPMP